MGIALSDNDAAAAVALLHESAYAYLAMTESGRPYVVPLNFAYVEATPETSAPADPTPTGGRPHTPLQEQKRSPLPGRIYFHTGEGRKTAALAADPRVCLAMTAGMRFVRGRSACRDGYVYRSLLVWGRAVCLEDAEARETALRAIVAKYDPGAAGQQFGHKDFGRTILYEVIIEDASYKQQA